MYVRVVKHMSALAWKTIKLEVRCEDIIVRIFNVIFIMLFILEQDFYRFNLV